MYKMLLYNNSKHFSSGPKQESDHHFSFSLTLYFRLSDICSINIHHVSTMSKALFQALMMIYEWKKRVLPGSSAAKESACNVGDPSLITGLGRSPGKGIGYPLQYSWASFVAQPVENPPVMWETWVRSLGWEHPWRRERLPTPVFWPREFRELYSPWGHKESDRTERLSLSLSPRRT